MASPERVAQVQEAITTHLQSVGPSNWDEIQKDFLDIPASCFWRHMAKPKMNSAFRLLGHARRFYKLHSDLLALRQHALDANGRIRDPQLFAKGIRLRNQILNDELIVSDGISRTDFNTKFFDAAMEAIANVSPDVAKAIFSSLNKLNEEFIKAANIENCN